jgi:hypothetical protein
MVGRSVQCKNCGQQFEVPREPARDQPPPAASPPALNRCPSCNTVVNQDAVICVQCGHNLKTGRSIADGTAGTTHVQDSLSLSGIYFTPFTQEFAVEAVAIILVAMGFVGVVALLSWFPCVGGLVGLVLFFVMLAWLASKYFELVERFESDQFSERESIWTDFAMLLWVSLVSWAPLGMTLLASQPPAVVTDNVPITFRISELYAGQVLLVAAAWGIIYWPMGVAQAGAYNVLSPIKVAQAIAANYKTYGLTLLFILPALIAADTLTDWLPAQLQVALSPLASLFIGFALGMGLWQYAFCAQFAMLGKMLKRHRTGRPLSKGEVKAALPWIASAVAACIVAIALAW